MAIQQVRQHALSLVPVEDSLSHESGLIAAVGPASAAPASEVRAHELPDSQIRISPRALADQVAHSPVANAHRLTRASFLTGDWGLVDVSRRGTELHVLLKPGALLVSSREQEVLDAVLSGVADRELSRRLGITRQCVCGHLGNALGKLGAASRFSALETWRALQEAEKGRTGRATLAEVSYGEDTLLSLRVPVPPRPELEVRLSSAETDVAWMVCDGLSNRDIAMARGTAERTVANQVASIFNKLNVSRRFDVAQFLLGLR